MTPTLSEIVLRVESLALAKRKKELKDANPSTRTVSTFGFCFSELG